MWISCVVLCWQIYRNHNQHHNILKLLSFLLCMRRKTLYLCDIMALKPGFRSESWANRLWLESRGFEFCPRYAFWNWNRCLFNLSQMFLFNSMEYVLNVCYIVIICSSEPIINIEQYNENSTEIKMKCDCFYLLSFIRLKKCVLPLMFL